MARRPRDNDDDVSLFPFLSIIACVIGVLTMMISTLALAQMDTPDVALIEAHENATKELEAAEVEVEALRSLLDEKIGPDAARVRKEVTVNQQELAKLAAELAEVQKQLKEQENVKVVIPTLDPAERESVSSMQAQFEDLTEETGSPRERPVRTRGSEPVEDIDSAGWHRGSISNRTLLNVRRTRSSCTR